MSTEPILSANSAIANLGGLLEFEKPLTSIQLDIDDMERQQRETGLDLAANIRQQRSKLKSKLKQLYGSLTPWETVLVARHPKRPLFPDYVQMMCRDYCELHGDRTFGDDMAMVTGFARIGGHRVMLIGHNKGRDVAERVACHFGCAHPEGYRKALSKMRLAEKFGLPVVCLIDTQGAYPGIGAEERGISHAIATNLMEMSRLRTPVVCVVIGEGGSGGALGIGVGDRVAMLQHSFYSVISPEGCAAILWKTAERRKHAAEALKLTGQELLRLGVVDEVIPEPLGGAHRDPEAAGAAVEKFIVGCLDSLRRLTMDALLHKRQERIRNLGACFEVSKPVVRPAPTVVTTRRAVPRASRLGSHVRGVEVPV